MSCALSCSLFSTCCRRGSRAMRRDYKLHEWFKEDLMRHAGKHRRPPHR